jgi:hypothetical protein
VGLLQHYIRLGAEHGPAYLKLDGDAREEIESIVDLIIDAAVAKMKAEVDIENMPDHLRGDDVG